MMKVLMLGNDDSVHGGITSVIEQIQSFNWKDEKIEMEFIPTYRNGSMLYKIYYFYRQKRKISEYIRKEHVNVVHMHMSHTGSFFRAEKIQQICIKRNVKNIVHLHGSEFKKFYFEASNSVKKRIKIFFENANMIIVLGKEWKEFIYTITNNCKIIVLNNSVKLPEKCSEQDKKVVRFLYLGVLIKRKGLMDLLQVVNNLKNKNLLKSNNLKIEFNIGGDGEEYLNLLRFVEENKLTEYVHFLGWINPQDKVNQLLVNDVFILPSHNEGLPMAILEAMSYGMPIISTNVGSIEEAVYMGENGYLYNPGDINKLEKIIIDCIGNYEKRVKMGQCSRKLVSEKFNFKKYYQDLVMVYQKI